MNRSLNDRNQIINVSLHDDPKFINKIILVDRNFIQNIKYELNAKSPIPKEFKKNQKKVMGFKLNSCNKTDVYIKIGEIKANKHIDLDELIDRLECLTNEELRQVLNKLNKLKKFWG